MLLENGTRVKIVRFGIEEVTGTIKGYYRYETFVYIVELDKRIPNYEYDAITVPAAYLEVLES